MTVMILLVVGVGVGLRVCVGKGYSVKFVAALVLLAGCATATPASTTLPPPVQPVDAAAVVGDYTPPPGALNPNVTPTTIRTTICVSGWTATIRPPVSYTTPLKLAQMKTRHLPGNPASYEEDHFVPLELGGAPRDPHNLWPEPRSGPHASAAAKDRAENALHAAVCGGTMTLTAAQHLIVNPTAWQ